MVSEAYAFAGAAGGQQGSNPYQGVIMLVLMFAIFYFLLIRPQQKKAKMQKEMIEALKVGDSIVTLGGIYGKVAALQENVVTVEIATGVKVKITRNSVASVTNEK
jgi:preprotein translocase subunit YajC